MGLLLPYNPLRELYVFFTVVMLLVPPAVFAWGDRGHEITGVIAYARLTAAAKRNVDALLAGDRDSLTAPDFVSRTNWADEYRDSDRQTTRKRYEQTRNWHFVNIDLETGKVSGCSAKLPPGTPASAGPANACILDKVDQFTTELRSRSTPRRETLLALKFLMHLLGDLHHPLHTADNRDRGGNDVAVVFGNPQRRESLHSLWDNYLVQRLGGDARFIGRSLDRQITAAQAQRWANGSAMDWAKEAFAEAKRVTYDFRKNGDAGASGQPAIQLDAEYEQRALPVVRQQLAKAGVRLARILNESFR
jgi:hypothetical protein